MMRAIVNNAGKLAVFPLDHYSFALRHCGKAPERTQSRMNGQRAARAHR
jgi:hypothetical protein